MAKRYMICPVIGNGQGSGFGNAYRAAVSDVAGVNSAAVITVSPSTGVPVYSFCLSRVATSGSLALVSAVSNSFVFPDFPLDSLLSQMDPDARSAMVQSVQAFNLDGNGFRLTLPNADTNSYRTVIDYIGKVFEPAFNADHFDASEPTQ